MKIVDVNVRRYRAPADEKPAPGYSGGEIVVVEVVTDEGLIGTGFATASPTTAPVLETFIRLTIGPVIKDQDPWCSDDLWRRMHQALPRRGGEGLMRLATAAVDFAVWDLKGKAAGVPVGVLFGSWRKRVPTYVNCAHHMAPEALAERAAAEVAHGHRALKIRGSFVTPAEATDRVRHVRSAIGPDVRLMVDVNGTWDVDTAIQHLKLWEKYDVYWLEEPVTPLDFAGYARVRARAGQTYIAAGEQHVGASEFRQLLPHIDVAQPNAAITGGITDWLRIYHLAVAQGIAVAPWNLQSIHMHMAAGLPHVKWIEYFQPDNALLAFQTQLFSRPVLREEVTEEGVFLCSPKGHGLELQLDPEMAERTLVRE
jgi:L-alanine-DL-glutamate epimerase-like enolase superfamily enzyme